MSRSQANSIQPIMGGSSSGLTSTVNLPKLDGTNYLSWIELVKIVLELRDLKSAIEGDDVDQVTDLQAELVLLESMNESHRAQVLRPTTASCS